MIEDQGNVFTDCSKLAYAGSLEPSWRAWPGIPGFILTEHRIRMIVYGAALRKNKTAKNSPPQAIERRPCGMVMVQPEVSHSRYEEEPEAKARWFQSLTLSERMDMLCFFTDLILSNSPAIADSRDDQPTSRRVRVVSKTRG
ncbi:MAG: hypothetical protein KIT57_13255 [Blastocatellales bacterium]|nr:hypothetical protein [Blastocatellales bacterium]